MLTIGGRAGLGLLINEQDYLTFTDEIKAVLHQEQLLFGIIKSSVSYMKLQRGVILIVIYIEEIIEAPVKINDAKILNCVHLFSK